VLPALLGVRHCRRSRRCSALVMIQNSTSGAPGPAFWRAPATAGAPGAARRACACAGERVQLVCGRPVTRPTPPEAAAASCRRLRRRLSSVSGPARPCCRGRGCGSPPTWKRTCGGLACACACKLSSGWCAQAGVVVELFRPAGGGVGRATVRLASGRTVKAPWDALEPA
jgi:hypothetical protein